MYGNRNFVKGESNIFNIFLKIAVQTVSMVYHHNDEKKFDICFRKLQIKKKKFRK